MVSITVTQLTCACLDAQWRRRWLKGERPTTRSFAPPGGLPVYGALFHRLADAFVGWLADSRRKTRALKEPPDLWHELYERFAIGELDRISRKGNLESAYHLSEALKAFCARIAALRARIPAFTSWQDLYLANEFTLKDVAVPAGQSSLLVSGRLDAVRFHPEHAVEVVDYKLTHGIRMKHDLVQLAIYTRLLALARPGLAFTGTLEYFEPKLHEVAVSREDLDGLFADAVLPALQEIAGRTAASGRAASPPAAPAPSPADDPTDHSGAIIRCFAAFNLEVEALGRQEAPQLVRYRIKPAPGVKVISLANRADDLKVALALPAAPVIEPAAGAVAVDIPKERPDTVFWRDAINREEFAANRSPLAFPVGVGVDNHLLVADFAEPTTCHGLVAGAAGSGKSEFLKSLAAAVIRRNTPEQLRLSIIDPKVLTFGNLPELPHLSEPVITELSAAIPCLVRAVDEMERRYRLMAAEGVEHLGARIAAGRSDLPYRLILFDEFGDLILAGREEKKEFERLVVRIAQKGRAAGIHLVLATQRPDRNVVTGLIKANLPLKICLRVVNAANSLIVLDQAGGEKLLGRGDLLCERGRGVERAQSPYVTQEELRALAG
jgi:S-DNA-T family DNA segregation ATPase FtsK/SpoIIIE